MSLNHDAFSHPLPKLCLCSPKFLAVAADHQRCFLLFCLFLLLFFGIHFFGRSLSTPVPLHVLRILHPEVVTHSTPWGSLYGEAASGCQRIRNSIYISNREINSARLLTPNLMKIWRR